MKTERRWIASMTTGAEILKVRLPWERGLRRAAMIHRRKAEVATPRLVDQPIRATG